MAIDPICHMEVDESTSLTSERFGKTYYFCSSHCRDTFLKKSNSNSLEGSSSEETPQKAASCCQSPPPKKHQESSCCGHTHTATEDVKPSSGAAYFCPMCPGVESPVPGDCPICGMALIPNPLFAGESAALEMGRKEWNEFLGAAVLTLPVFVLAMLHLVPSMARADWYHAPWVVWVQAILTTLVLGVSGRSIFVRGWRSLVTWNLNMWTLISVGVGAAFVFSWWSMWQLGSSTTHGGHSALGIYFESAAVIVTFVLLGQYLEARAHAKTGAALKELMQLSPEKAWRLTPHGEEEVLTKELRVGDRLRVKAGEKVPVDGVVVEGSGAVDESLLTGESLPVQKAADDAVTGGTMNLQGSFIMTSNRVGADTLLSQMIHAVSEAQHSRAPIQSLADRVASVFVPVVFAVSVITAIVWFFLAQEAPLQKAIEHAVAVLVIACPCALGLATPLSVMVGIGRAAKQGILIRSAEALERLEKVNTVVFDKTGTLTEGKAELIHVIRWSQAPEESLLQWAASLERGSTHPLAFAMVKAAHARALPSLEVQAFQQHQAAGVEGVLAGERMLVGSLGYLRNEGVNVELAEREKLQDLVTPVYLAIGKEIAARFDFQDRLKPKVQETLQHLQSVGVENYLLSGDREKTVQAFAKNLPLHAALAGQTPHSKRDFIQTLQKQEGKVVAMVGDGINDAIALSVADVGIAVSDGSDVAKQSAAVTLLHGDLSRVDTSLQLGKLTMKNICQNLFFAFFYNALGIPLAAGLFAPIFGWHMSPMIAGLAMSFSSVSVILNSLRLGTQALEGTADATR